MSTEAQGYPNRLNPPKPTGSRTNRLSSLTCQSIMTSIMQNKPNFPDPQMNVNIYYTKDYKNFIPLAGQKNKPNSNPIKPNFQKAQMNVNLTLTKDYRKKDDFIVRINKHNFQNAKNERKRFFTKGL